MSRVSSGANTLGNIAREYSMSLPTLMALIAAYPDLKADIDIHMVNVRNRGQKVLPPIVINKIFSTLGEP